MPRNTSGLKRGGQPGRTLGSKNKATREMQEFWQTFLASDAYAESAKERMLAGKAPHLETYWVSKIHGKPVERHEVSGPEGGPLPYTWLPPQL